jgi:hypothetical protein
LSAQGVYLMSRQDPIYNISLYGLNGIFIEVWYFKMDDEIDRIEVVKEQEVLDIYLDRIKLKL